MVLKLLLKYIDLWLNLHQEYMHVYQHRVDMVLCLMWKWVQTEWNYAFYLPLLRCHFFFRVMALANNNHCWVWKKLWTVKVIRMEERVQHLSIIIITITEIVVPFWILVHDLSPLDPSLYSYITPRKKRSHHLNQYHSSLLKRILLLHYYRNIVSHDVSVSMVVRAIL